MPFPVHVTFCQIIDKELMEKEAKGEIEKQKIVPVNKSMVSKGGLLDQAKAVAEKMIGGGEDSGNTKATSSSTLKMPEMPKMPWDQ